jgi:hypothetical protein
MHDLLGMLSVECRFDGRNPLSAMAPESLRESRKRLKETPTRPPTLPDSFGAGAPSARAAVMADEPPQAL